jgi:hypothetical protein
MVIRRLALIVFALAFVGAATRADESPRFEVFGGYSYGQLNPGGRLAGGNNAEGQHFALSGWHVAGQTKVFKCVGLVLDLSGYAGTSDVDLLAVHSRYNGFLAGPQINIRKFGRFNIFGHGLVGVARERVFLKTGSTTDDNKITRLAGAFGGGVDMGITKHVAIRAFEADYLLSSFPSINSLGQSAGAHQSNVRVSTGIVYGFGGR